MYHEVIDRRGNIYLTRPDTHIVWACMLANPISYNICLDATDGSDATDAQVDTLIHRLDTLRAQYNSIPKARVQGHGELTQYGNSTSCPGPRLLEAIRAYRG